jgi:uncharacterized protein
MIKALFTSDLHGSEAKYNFLFQKIHSEKPTVVFIGGDLLGYAGFGSNNTSLSSQDFFRQYLAVELKKLKMELKDSYPKIFIILGNDDSISFESALLELEAAELLTYAHNRRIEFMDYIVVGYSYIPPTPFQNKDWEKYDVSGYVDIGCVSPEEGSRSVPVSSHDLRYHTIKRDLKTLFDKLDMSKTICLFHSPPYQTNLDRAALDGKVIDHVPFDVNVGSIAIKEFITEDSPLITMHGHIHESTLLTGIWMEKFGRTVCFQGATVHDDIAIIKFDLENAENAETLKQGI